MKLTSVGEIIAERKLVLRGDSGPDREVFVLLGKPQLFSDSTDYFCPYQIKGIGEEKIKYMGGVDAFQAISCVLQALGAELQVLNQKESGKLSWDADENESLGFPIPE
jgi:hypothetical protein